MRGPDVQGIPGLLLPGALRRDSNLRTLDLSMAFAEVLEGSRRVSFSLGLYPKVLNLDLALSTAHSAGGGGFPGFPSSRDAEAHLYLKGYLRVPDYFTPDTSAVTIYPVVITDLSHQLDSWFLSST